MAGAFALGIRRALAALALASALTTVLAASAAARPPQLATAGAANGIATASWSLPANVRSEFFEIANLPDVNPYGYFQCNKDLRGEVCDEGSIVVRFGVLNAGQTALESHDATPALSPGTYYIHIAGHDNVHDGCASIEFSDMWKLEVGASTTVGSLYGPGTGDCTLIRPKPGTPGGGSVGGGGKFTDETPPTAQLRYSKRQDIDKLRVRARMSEPGTLAVRALVDVGGLLARIYNFRPRTRKVAGGVLTTLPLKLSKKNKRALKRAMRKRKRLRVRVTLTAVDRAGNTTTKHATIRLKR
jgi:hypothetical protein